ncbi:MAG: YfhO family protein, partial [Chloroflexota bacterium]
PYLYGGQPALADIQSGALYPPHVVQALILGWGGPLFGWEIGFPLWALELQVVMHLSLASVGTYLFIRSLTARSTSLPKKSQFASVISALTFTYSGYLTGFPVQQITILEVSAWLPWVLWGIHRCYTHLAIRATTREIKTSKDVLFLMQASWRSLVGASLAFALALLAGHPQTVLYIFYLSLAYTIFFAFRASQLGQLSFASHRPFIPQVTPFLVYGLLWVFIIALGSGVAAAQLLPTLEFISYSLRADLTYEAVSAGLPLNEMMSILYPGFFGGSPGYVGIVPLILIAVAVVLGRPRAQVLFWGGTGITSLLLAFGGHTFLYPLFYLLTPGFEAVRQQERAFLLYSFSAAVLAGLGAITLVSPLSQVGRRRYLQLERSLRWIGVIGVGLTAIFIYGATIVTARGDEVNLFVGVLRHHLFGMLLLGGGLILLALRPRRWLYRPWGMSLIAIWLIFNLFTINWQFNLEKPGDSPPFAQTPVIQFLQTNLFGAPERIVSGGLLPQGNSAAAVHKLPDLTGNTPLQLARVDQFYQKMPAWRLWQLMNVQYIVDQRDISDAGLTLVFESEDLMVFEMGDPFPRAWFVDEVEEIPNGDQALARLASDNFDLRKKGIVESAIDVIAPVASDSSVDAIASSPTSLTLQTATSATHLLIISQIYYPGWQAEIDGQSVDVHRVNVIQQGLVIPPGDHAVTLSFRPATFMWGGYISITTLLTCLILYIGSFRRLMDK